MIKRTLFTLALIASAGAVHAQGEPADPYGRPLIGREDWVVSPATSVASAAGMAQPSWTCPHAVGHHELRHGGGTDEQLNCCAAHGGCARGQWRVSRAIPTVAR